MQSAGSSNTSYLIRNDSQRPVSCFSSVTAASPAKRITFFKSGDAQFSGVRMAIHKRSFKCFDALLDDLSQKMPLPFGVRTITTPRGTHSIQRLEQLEDRGCYLCSDRHYVKPIDMEAAGKQPAVWHHSHPHNTRRKPSRPEEPPTGHSDHHYHRHPRRIMLVKNNDPAVRRSIIVSRRMARSLRVFMDEISELMQYHVRKLYTLEGRKIDSIQSLMQCPSMLVCVGREPFKPLLLENLRKHSEEKLPGIGARSHSSIYSEGHESKKNVNFGLETKKSIIHPRSDSSNKSTRFSLSSEKSYPNGSGMTSGQPGCVTKEVVLNDDIEKRVLVNKDGSLSVEMKVRFRLDNDETLQWSTEIKKLPTTANESSSLKEADPHYLQGKAQYSDPESNSPCEAEEACATKLHQKQLKECYCQDCCNHSQGYDIWKNPMHKDNGIRSCSSSTGSSHKIMHQKASVDSVCTISRSSEEYTEHVVKKASCFRQTVEEGDTRVQYCSISRCCSQSEVLSSATKCNIPTDVTCESNTGIIYQHNCNGQRNITEFDNSLSDATKVTEHPISATSNSSKVLESFKKDQGDDYDDISPSASRASEWCLESDKQFTCVHCYGSQAPQNLHLSHLLPSKVSSCSADAFKPKTYRSVYAAPEVPQEDHADTDRTESARSSVSKVSSRSQCCRYSHCREATPSSVASDMKSGLEERIQISMSEGSKVSIKSRAKTNSPRAPVSVVNGAQEVCEEETKSGNRSISAMSAKTGFSGKSTVCPCCGGCERLMATLPGNIQDIQAQVAEEDVEVKSLGHRSSKSPGSKRSNKCTRCASQRDCAISNIFGNTQPVQNNVAEIEVRHASSQSALSDLSNLSAASKRSNKSNRTACGRSSVAESMVSENTRVEDVEGRTKSAMSIKSNVSAKSRTNSVIPDGVTTSGLESQNTEEIGNLHMAQENITETENVTKASDIYCKERVPSSMSAKTHSSKDSAKSHKSNNHIPDTATSSPPNSPSPSTDTFQEKIHSGRSTIVLPKSSKVSMKSNACSERDSESVMNSTNTSAGQETRQATEDAKNSAQNSLPVASPSLKIKKIFQAPSTPKSPITAGNNNQALSVKSVHSKASSKSTRSNKCHCSSSRCVERVANSPSEKSKSAKSPTPAPYGPLDEPLSPTSTASVSLGLGEEERTEDLNERSMSITSQILDDDRPVSEKYTPEPAASDSVFNSSKIVETRERVKTAASMSSAVSEKSKRSHDMQGPCKNPDQAISPVSVAKPESIMSTKSKAGSMTEVQLVDEDHRVPSALSASSDKSLQKSPSKNNSTIKCCKGTIQAINENTEKGETNKTIPESSSKSSQNKITSGKATVPGATEFKKQCTTKSKESATSNLEIKETKKTNCNSDASVKSRKTFKSDKEQASKYKSVAKSKVSQNCATPADEMPNKTMMPVIHLDSTGDSVLPHTVLATDLLREKATDVRPGNRGSRSNTSGKNCVLEEVQHIGSKCKKSSRYKQRKVSTASQIKREDHGEDPLMPSSLPNASPTEVVNDWLKNIPFNGPMYVIEDEFNEQHDKEVLQIPTVKEEASLQNEIGEPSETLMKMKEFQEIVGPGGADPVKEDKNTICDESQACNETSQTIANTDLSPLSPKLTKRESLTNHCQSSIQVMKVLLSPKLDRCNSLPEVSPTYGRKLSTSAKGLLDCLANLQVIDSDPKLYDKYSKIISILQSLWSHEPSETKQDKHKIKDHHSAEDDFNPRSSSGVDLSSGSIGSGKGSISGGVEKSEIAQCIITPIAEQEAFLHSQGNTIMEGGCDFSSATQENIDTLHVPSDPITPDIAERVQCSPSDEKLNEETQKDEAFQAIEEVIQNNENIEEIKKVAATFSTRSSGNDSNVLKSVADKEAYSPENTYSETSPSDQKGKLTKKTSQDPDPVWVLSLLKKLENQFMSHYANAIAEFKVRWDLNDNETLDIMISELKEEVHKRIQSTINRELQKIQSRAGRTPRPPISTLSRDSTVQTEQRRRRLKGMQNKLVNPSRSEDESTASGTEFSDQRSEDEYCPCDTCMKKKMASRVVQRAEALSLAPVLKDFDLRKILQTKKDPHVTMPVQYKLEEQKVLNKTTDYSNVQDKNNLEVVHEEANVHNISQIDKDDDIKEEETKDEKADDVILASENQDTDVGVIGNTGEAVEEGQSNDGNERKAAEKREFDNKGDGADDGETEKERERPEMGKDEEDKSANNKKEEVENGEAACAVDEMAEEEAAQAEEATEGDTTSDEKAAKEEDPPDEEAAEIKETESSEIEEGEGDLVEEKESRVQDKRTEEERPEEETNKDETGEAEEEEGKEIEEKAETADEGEETEDGTGDEAESTIEGKTSGDESGDAENSNATSDERTRDDVSAAAAEAKPGKNEIAKITEGEKTDTDDITSKSEGETSTENNGNGNSTETEDETEGDSHENEDKTHVQKPKEIKLEEDSISVEGQVVTSLQICEEEDVEQADVEDCGINEKHQNDTGEESIDVCKNQAEEPAHPSHICGKDSDCRLITQITKTSVESQPGSLEYSKDLTVKEKLRDIHSFMESLDNQEDT